ncbi:hypothetical protein QE152_g24488 [Popillia japonica]|uniref:Uncharacterized protein n=1 Tax=Popillia japonica TaxID=7064 RepID=A0AAW1KAW4_POPJA
MAVLMPPDCDIQRCVSRIEEDERIKYQFTKPSCMYAVLRTVDYPLYKQKEDWISFSYNCLRCMQEFSLDEGRKDV